MTKRRWKKVSVDAEARKERLFAGRVPGEGLTLEQWRALGYDRGGSASRPLTQDPLGAHPHPHPKESS